MVAGKEKGHTPTAALGSGLMAATSCVHTGPDLPQLLRGHFLWTCHGEGRPPRLASLMASSPALPLGHSAFQASQQLAIPPRGTRMFFSRRLACWPPSERACSHRSPLYLPFPICSPSSRPHPLSLVVVQLLSVSPARR